MVYHHLALSNTVHNIRPLVAGNNAILVGANLDAREAGICRLTLCLPY